MSVPGSPGFPRLAASYDPGELEARILHLWRKEEIFRRTVEERPEERPFVFFEGPPTANGRPGIHHVMARTLKDLICRYKTMRGYRVSRKAGWDTHGLPVEIEVEKRLGISGKSEIEKVGIETFNRLCRESVFTYKKDWEELSDRIGYWLDYSDPYVTCTNEYIESVWWLLAKFHREGLLYRDHKVIPYCPRCGTGLSSHEVAQGYREVEDPSVYLVLGDPDREGQHYLVWTTTPWTLPANVALAVHPDLVYERVRWGKGSLWLAASRVQAVFGESGVARGGEGAAAGAPGRLEVLERLPGRDLAGRRYVRPLPYVPLPEGAVARIHEADFVSEEDGSGFVHCAPAFGEDDLRLARRRGLPILQPVDASGRFVAGTGPYGGRFVKEADPDLLEDLRGRGVLLAAARVRHSYPFCWRCDSPLLYYAKPSWFLRTTARRSLLMERNASIRWVPPEIGSGRFGEWLEGNVDWALSRERYWGTPLPLWTCERCGSVNAIASIDELRSRGGDTVPAELDLHKPQMDGVTLDCSCGGTMRRAPEVIDVWFDSGAMPFAQWHYPFANEERFLRDRFPAAFICEGVDQTRGWFYSLHAIATLALGRVAYESVLVNELVLDKDGQKMSKSRGNAVDPWAVIREHGVDPLRWYSVTASQPWIPTRFDASGVDFARRKFFGTLHNCAGFFSLYASIDGFLPQGMEPPLPERSLLDRWILSRLQTQVEAVRGFLDGDSERGLPPYQVTHAARGLQEFVLEDLSHWYIRRSRRRFWTQGEDASKDAAFWTLWEVLREVARMLAPFAPFFADGLWQDLVRSVRPDAEVSVHLARFPEPDPARRDARLEVGMRHVRDAAALGRELRTRAGLRVRQPLARLTLTTGDAAARASLEQCDELLEILRDELNVKDVRIGEGLGATRSVRVDPNLPRLGPRYGKKLRELVPAIRELGVEEIERMRREGVLILEVAGESMELVPGDLLVHEEANREQGELPSGRQGVWSGELDTRLSEGLRDEGIVRELINRIQGLRKARGFDVSDRIRISIHGSQPLQRALDGGRDRVLQECLGVDLAWEDASPCGEDVDLGRGVHATVTLQKA